MARDFFGMTYRFVLDRYHEFICQTFINAILFQEPQEGRSPVLDVIVNLCVPDGQLFFDGLLLRGIQTRLQLRRHIQAAQAE